MKGGMHQLLEARKVKETESFLEPPERHADSLMIA